METPKTSQHFRKHEYISIIQNSGRLSSPRRFERRSGRAKKKKMGGRMTCPLLGAITLSALSALLVAFHVRPRTKWRFTAPFCCNIAHETPRPSRASPASPCDRALSLTAPSLSPIFLRREVVRTRAGRIGFPRRKDTERGEGGGDVTLVRR